MKFIGMNRYTTLGFRESFLEHFFELGNDCWSSKELGNLHFVRHYLICATKVRLSERKAKELFVFLLLFRVKVLSRPVLKGTIFNSNSKLLNSKIMIEQRKTRICNG